MNQRIFELLANARDITVEQCMKAPYGSSILTPTQLEKFAELIVRECAGRVDHILREWQAGGGTMGDDIREHFGVEE